MRLTKRQRDRAVRELLGAEEALPVVNDNNAVLTLAGPNQVNNENGYLIAEDPDGGTRNVTLIGITENLAIDTVFVVAQGNTGVSL